MASGLYIKGSPLHHDVSDYTRDLSRLHRLVLVSFRETYSLRSRQRLSQKAPICASYSSINRYGCLSTQKFTATKAENWSRPISEEIIPLCRTYGAWHCHVGKWNGYVSTYLVNYSHSLHHSTQTTQAVYNFEIIKYLMVICNF